MTPGKAGGLLGERLKGANNTVSRLKAADFFSFPLEGGRGGNRKRSGGPFPRRAGGRAFSPPPAGEGGGGGRGGAGTPLTRGPPTFPLPLPGGGKYILWRPSHRSNLDEPPRQSRGFTLN